jgi:DNA-binding HxlR family transcriptional regulator
MMMLATAATPAHLVFHFPSSLSRTKHLNYRVSSKVETMCERSGKPDRLCLCPLEGIIDAIGKKWTLLVVNAIGNHGRLRFSQMMEELKISPTTLTETLQELQREGLIGRESFAEIPPRVEYSLTKDGVQLRKAILPLLQWASTRTVPGKKRCSARYRQIAAHQITIPAQ